MRFRVVQVCLFGMGGEQPYRDYGILIYIHVVRSCLKVVPESFNVSILHLVDLDCVCLRDVCFDPFCQINHVHHWRLNFPTCDSSRRIPESLVESPQSQTNSQAELWNKSKPIPSKYNIFIPSHMLEILFVHGVHLEFVKSSDHQLPSRFLNWTAPRPC